MGYYLIPSFSSRSSWPDKLYVQTVTAKLSRVPEKTLMENKTYTKACLEQIFKTDGMSDIPRPCQQSSLCMDDDKVVCNEQMDWLKLDEKLPIWSRLKVVNCVGNLRELIYERNYMIEIPDRLWSLWGNSDIQTVIGRDMLTVKGHDLVSSILALCVSLKHNLNSWTPRLLDNIVAKGSEIFLEMIQKHNMTDVTFNEKFLTASYLFDDTIFNVKVQPAASGYVYVPFGRGEYNMSRALVWFFKNYQFGLVHCNFRVLAIGYAVDINNGFFMYDGQSKGPPLMADGEYNSYVLRTGHLQILLYCIIVALNVIQDNVKFDIYTVDIETDEKLIAKLTRSMKHDLKSTSKNPAGKEKKVFIPKRKRAEALQKYGAILNYDAQYVKADADKENKFRDASLPITTGIPQNLATQTEGQNGEIAKQEVQKKLTKNHTTQVREEFAVVTSKGAPNEKAKIEKNELQKYALSRTSASNIPVNNEATQNATLSNIETTEQERKLKVQLVNIKPAPFASASTIKIIYNPTLAATVVNSPIPIRIPMKHSLIENKSNLKPWQGTTASTKTVSLASALKRSSINEPTVHFTNKQTSGKTERKMKAKATGLKKAISSAPTSLASNNQRVSVHTAFAINSNVKALKTAPSSSSKRSNYTSQIKATEKRSKSKSPDKKKSFNPANIVLSTQYADSNNNSEPKIYLVKNEEKANLLKYKTSNPKVIVVNQLSDLIAERTARFDTLRSKQLLGNKKCEPLTNV
uniref:Uncharacterized protein n=1 Tax=Glossina pallidipes TaxID=7398 RepID=A0A1B0AAK1_GLOPL